MRNLVNNVFWSNFPTLMKSLIHFIPCFYKLLCMLQVLVPLSCTRQRELSIENLQLCNMWSKPTFFFILDLGSYHLAPSTVIPSTIKYQPLKNKIKMTGGLMFWGTSMLFYKHWKNNYSNRSLITGRKVEKKISQLRLLFFLSSFLSHHLYWITKIMSFNHMCYTGPFTFSVPWTCMLWHKHIIKRYHVDLIWIVLRVHTKPTLMLL